MHIDHYDFGTITIDSKNYQHDVIIFPDHIQPEWWRDNGHLLQIQDLETILATKPKKLIIGTGHSGQMKISPHVIELLQKEHIELVSAFTTEATKLYNEIEDKSEVVGGFHLTC